MLEGQKIERNGDPWQPTFLFEDGTHSNSKVMLYSGHGTPELIPPEDGHLSQSPYLPKVLWQEPLVKP